MSAKEIAKQKIEEGNKCLEILSNYDVNKIHGLSKFIRKIQAEIKFLQKVMKKEFEFDVENIECSNICQLAAIVDVLQNCDQVTGVSQTFTSVELKKLSVDIVCNDGAKWVKVVMRNPEALHHLFKFGQRGGNKPITTNAEQYLVTAQENLHLYNPPQVNFMFLKGVSEELSNYLKEMGILVTGEIVPVSSNQSIDDEFGEDSNDDFGFDLDQFLEDFENLKSQFDNQIDSEVLDIINNQEKIVDNKTQSNLDHKFTIIKEPLVKEEKLVSKVNLDVTAMVAYVTATTNGGSYYTFQDEFLTNQAQWERQYPVKPCLDKYFSGNELYVCQSAINQFNDIVNTIGGPGEKRRAEELVKRLTVVEDLDIFENDLPLKGRIKPISRIIFGTGQALKAITITANKGFIRAANNRGIKLAVRLHGPRGLTEMKETDATLIEGS